VKPAPFPGLPIKRDLEFAYRLSLAVAALMVAASAARIMLGLHALLTFGQDATGALLTALAEGAPADPAARHVWISDLTLGAPATLVGGALLWLRRPLGYAAGAELLLSYGLTPIGLVASMALRSLLTGSPLDVGTTVALLVIGAITFAPLAFFFRGVEGARAGRAEVHGSAASLSGGKVRGGTP
jgi:hypothetical protein